MHSRILFIACVLGAVTLSAALAASLTQTFEAGEDTSNWGASWVNGEGVATFLDPSLGGQNAGTGDSGQQTFSRSFRNNTVGLDVTEAYSLGMYVRVDAVNPPASGLFEIVDGSFGSANAANLGIRTEDLGGGNFAYHWQARDNSTAGRTSASISTSPRRITWC